MDAFYTENIVTEKYGYNMTINLYQDIDAPNPFDEFDTLGTLETFTSATEYRERIEQFDKERSIFVEGSTREPNMSFTLPVPLSGQRITSSVLQIRH